MVLVDLQMPELSGIDVLKAVRAADPECQVILMTGNATVETAIEAVKAGALDYLAKPLDFDRLRKLLVDVRDGIHRRERMMAVDAEVAEPVRVPRDDRAEPVRCRSCSTRSAGWRRTCARC